MSKLSKQNYEKHELSRRLRLNKSTIGHSDESRNRDFSNPKQFKSPLKSNLLLADRSGSISVNENMLNQMNKDRRLKNEILNKIALM